MYTGYNFEFLIPTLLMTDYTGTSKSSWTVTLDKLPDCKCCNYHEPSYRTHECYNSRHTGRQDNLLEVC